MTDAPEYPFTIRPMTAAEGGGYLIAFPDLSGCIASGRTVSDAIDAGAEARQSWIEQRTAAGREVPPPRSVTDRPKPRVAPWIKEFIERIGLASTQDEWNRCAADAVFKVMFGDPERRGETVTAMGDWRLPLGLRLSELIEVGFTPKPHRAPNVLQGQDDARLLASCLRRYPEMTLADASYGFGIWFEIKEDTARKRVSRAEEILSVTLPREARAFRPPRTGKRASRRVRLEKSRPL